MEQAVLHTTLIGIGAAAPFILMAVEAQGDPDRKSRLREKVGNLFRKMGFGGKQQRSDRAVSHRESRLFHAMSPPVVPELLDNDVSGGSSTPSGVVGAETTMSTHSSVGPVIQSIGTQSHDQRPIVSENGVSNERYCESDFPNDHGINPISSSSSEEGPEETDHSINPTTFAHGYSLQVSSRRTAASDVQSNAGTCDSIDTSVAGGIELSGMSGDSASAFS
jgi:hypothetical protein